MRWVHLLTMSSTTASLRSISLPAASSAAVGAAPGLPLAYSSQTACPLLQSSVHTSVSHSLAPSSVVGPPPAPSRASSHVWESPVARNIKPSCCHYDVDSQQGKIGCRQTLDPAGVCRDACLHRFVPLVQVGSQRRVGRLQPFVHAWELWCLKESYFYALLSTLYVGP